MDKPKRDRREYNLKWSAENAERKKAAHKKWRDANKARIREYDDNYKAKDPDGYKAMALARTKKWQAEHREQYLEQSRASYQANAEERRAKSKTYRKKYYAEKRELWLAYGRKARGLPEPTRPCPSVCECCGSPPSDKQSLHLDHCHETGAFRGWLCKGCNHGLGFLGDNIAGLERALAYLKRALDA